MYRAIADGAPTTSDALYDAAIAAAEAAGWRPVNEDQINASLSHLVTHFVGRGIREAGEAKF